jgi:hypothetical protein
VLTFTRNFGPVPAQAVEDVERRLKIKFPTAYRQFLLAINGGEPEPRLFTVPGCGDALVAILYGIQVERTPGDLEWEQEQATLWEPFPPGVIAIGNDPGDNKLLLWTLGEREGQVSFWDRNGLWRTRAGQNTFPVAASFTEFLQSLREE